MDQPTIPWLKRTLWRHPQWWMFGVSLLAWLAMMIRLDSTGAGLTLAHQHHHVNAFSMRSWITETSRWMLMIVAMMFPFIADSARKVAARSLWIRRQRAIAGFILGYLCVWLIAGIALSLAISYFKTQTWVDTNAVIGWSFMAAAAWQFTSVKRRALFSCHRTMPIAPEGWQADCGCVRYGCVIGGSCLLNCWAWMLFCTLTGHNLVAMLFAAFIGIAERYPIRKIKFPVPFASSFTTVR